MKQLSSLFAIACLALFLGGCGQQQSTEAPVSNVPDITLMPKKWREAHTKGAIFGFTMEKRDGKIVGKLCILEPGDEFKIKNTSGEGEYMPTKNALILPYHDTPPIGTLQEKLEAGLPHVSVVLDPTALELKGQLVSPSAKQTYTFVPVK